MDTGGGCRRVIRDNLLQTFEALKSRGPVYYPPPQRTWDDIARQFEDIIAQLVEAQKR